MSALVGVLLLVSAWWNAATRPTAEIVTVSFAAPGSDATQSSSFAVQHTPGVGGLKLEIGPLLIESASDGVWAAHRRDPSTIALLRTSAIGSLADLAEVVPPTPAPSAALGLATPDSPWAPVPQSGVARWERCTVLVRGGWPAGLRLEGRGEHGALQVEIRRGRLATIRADLKDGRGRALGTLRVTLEPTPVRPREALDRTAFRVRSLFDLRALGPSLGRGQQLPGALRLTDASGALRFDELEWPGSDGERVVVFVAAAPASQQAEALQQIQAMAGGQQWGGGDVLALLDGPGAEAGRRRAADVSSRLQALARVKGVYAISEQHRLLWRLAGSGRADAIVVTLGAGGVIQAVEPLEGLFSVQSEGEDAGR